MHAIIFCYARCYNVCVRERKNPVLREWGGPAAINLLPTADISPENVSILYYTFLCLLYLGWAAEVSISPYLFNKLTSELNQSELVRFRWVGLKFLAVFVNCENFFVKKARLSQPNPEVSGWHSYYRLVVRTRKPIQVIWFARIGIPFPFFSTFHGRSRKSNHISS